MMTLTMDELKQFLARKDPDELLDLLQIDSETLLELASDLISDRFEELCEEVSDDIQEFGPEEWR